MSRAELSTDVSAFGYMILLKAAVIGLFVVLGGSIVQMISACDASIYLRIAQNWYYDPHDPNLYVFGPFYPALIRLFGGLWAAFFIANIFAVASVYLLYKISNIPTALLLATFPTFLVFGTSGYADPIMVFFLILSYWFYKKDKYWPMALSLALAAVTKYTALFAIPIFLLFVAYKRRTNIKAYLPFLIPVCAMGGIMLWLWKVAADPLAFIHLQAAWGAAGLVDPITQANWVLHGWFTNQGVVLANSQPWQWLARNYVFQLPMLALLILAAKRGKWELSIIGLTFTVLTLTTIGMPAISTPRLLLPGVWPLFLAYKDEIKAHKELAIMLAVMFAGVGLLWLLYHSQGGFVA
jgi:hypothetical protein